MTTYFATAPDYLQDSRQLALKHAIEISSIRKDETFLIDLNQLPKNEEFSTEKFLEHITQKGKQEDYIDSLLNTADRLYDWLLKDNRDER